MFIRNSFAYLKVLYAFLNIFMLDGQDSPGSGPLRQDSSNNASKPVNNGNGAGPKDSQARNSSFSSMPLVAQRKIFAESKIGRSSFQKLLEPRPPQLPGIAPYRIVLGNVKEKVLLSLLILIIYVSKFGGRIKFAIRLYVFLNSVVE